MTLLSGEEKTGELLDFNAATVRLDTLTGPVEIAIDQVERVHLRDAARSKPENVIQDIRLVDGSRFSAKEFTVKKRAANFFQIGDGSLPPLEIETRNIDWVRTNLSEAINSEWNAAVENVIKADALLIAKEGAIDSLEGLIQDISETTIDFKFDDDLINVKRSKVSGVRFYHAAGRRFPTTLCSIGTISGDRFMARSIGLESETLEVNLVAGDSIKLSLEQVSEFDFTVGKLLYVSDINDIAHQWAPQIESGPLASQLGQLLTWQRDLNLQKRRLRLFSATSFSASDISTGSQRNFRKGIAVRSGTKLAFDVPGDFKRLTGVAGIDPAVRPQGDVLLKISADGKQIYSSEITGQDQEPKMIDVDLKSAKRIVVHVDYGKNSDVADHLNLCNLRLIR